MSKNYMYSQRWQSTNVGDAQTSQTQSSVNATKFCLNVATSSTWWLLYFLCKYEMPALPFFVYFYTFSKTLRIPTYYDVLLLPTILINIYLDLNFIHFVLKCVSKWLTYFVAQITLLFYANLSHAVWLHEVC